VKEFFSNSPLIAFNSSLPEYSNFSPATAFEEPGVGEESDQS
jgi:hypothetical protein